MKKWQKPVCVFVSSLLLLSQMPFGVFADEQTEPVESDVTETMQEMQSADAADEQTTDSTETLIRDDSTEVQTEAEDAIHPGMTQDEIDQTAKTAETVMVEAGDYGDCALHVSGKNTVILAGEETTGFSVLTVENGVLELRNSLSLNAKGALVESDKSILGLTNSSVNGNGNTLTVFSQNSGNNKASAYAASAAGESVVLNNLNLMVSGMSGDRGLLNINSVSFEAYGSNLQVSGNGGWNIWGNAGSPNICVGHDTVCATRKILFKDCTVNASGAQNPYGDGMQLNKTADPCTITFDSCTVQFDNNGGNGFMGQMSKGDNTKKVNVIDSNVSACGNGTGRKGVCIGFANANINLMNTTGVKGAFTFRTSDNYKLGVAANKEPTNNNLPGGFSSIQASGYAIIAEKNGTEGRTGADGIYGYGIYLGRSGSAFENCTLAVNENKTDGLTLAGETPITISNCDLTAVKNGGHGLVIEADTIISGGTMQVSCNGAGCADEVDTSADSSISFANGVKGSIGRAALNAAAESDEASRIIADPVNGECDAVTKGDEIILLKEGQTTVCTEGDLAHHAMDLANGEFIEDPTDEAFGCMKVVCGICGRDTVHIPLVRIDYVENTEDTVENMPEDRDSCPYGSAPELNKVPERDGYMFTGWHLDPETKQKAPENLTAKIPTLRLYAGWTDNSDSDESGTAAKAPLTAGDRSIGVWHIVLAASLIGILFFRRRKPEAK